MYHNKGKVKDAFTWRQAIVSSKKSNNNFGDSDRNDLLSNQAHSGKFFNMVEVLVSQI